MAGIPDYSTTASSNATVGAISFAEGQAPSSLNDSARALMADIAAEAQLETVSGTDTYTVTYDIVPSAYSTKMRMCLLFTNANTSTTPTLNVNSLGAKTIVDCEGGALVAGSIAASSAHIGIYDGTNIRLLTVNATPTLGAVTYNGALLSSSATGGVGYATGAGGTVTQATSKATGVTLNKTVGKITTHAANLNAATSVTFTFTNSSIAANDLLLLNIGGGASVGSYSIFAEGLGSGSRTIHLRNESAGTLGEAVDIMFVVIKGVVA